MLLENLYFHFQVILLYFRKEVINMKYEKPSMVIVKQEPVKHAVGPDGCSTKYTGCCYKD